MKEIAYSEYMKIHKDFRGVWEREDHPELIGKRTMMANENGATVLLIESLHFKIVGEQK